jgi:phosphate transport system protein
MWFMALEGGGVAGEEPGRAPRLVPLEPRYHGPRRAQARARAQDMDPQPQGKASPLVVENLARIRATTLAMGDKVDEAIQRATDGLLHRDIATSNEVIRGDAEVNALQAETRQLCFTTILGQAPPARELRELLGFQHMAAELERMADHCVNIARVARDLADLPPLEDYVDIPKLSSLVAKQVRDILTALVSHDIDEARAVAARDDLINRLYHRLVDELIQIMSDDPARVYQGTKLITACQNYERIADRVTNLAEDLVFLEAGDIEDLG